MGPDLYETKNEYAGEDQQQFTGLDWTGLDWTGLDRTGPDRTIYIDVNKTR
jgi:hypothetical protein